MTRNSNRTQDAEIRPAADETNLSDDVALVEVEGSTTPETVALVDPDPDFEATSEDDTDILAEPIGALLGDTIDIGAASGMVRLPDGTVVTCRSGYTARHVGEHVFFTMSGGWQVETTVTVTDPNAPLDAPLDEQLDDEADQ